MPRGAQQSVPMLTSLRRDRLVKKLRIGSIVVLLLVFCLLSGGCAPSPTVTRVPPLPVPTDTRPVQGPKEPPATARPTLTSPAAKPTNTVGSPVPPEAGAPAFGFTLKDLQGQSLSLRDLRGKKVMLNFWATWCGPCRIEIPSMVKLYDEFHSRGFEILAVNLREDSAKVAQFVKQSDMRFPILLDKGGIVATNYFVRGIPTSVFVDDEGIIQNVHVGTMSESVMRAYIVELLD